MARATFAVDNVTKRTRVADRVQSGGSFWQRFRGLMGRSSLAPGEALWLPATTSIHMMFMKFAIDCAFLSREQADGSRRVVAVRHGLPPWRGVVWWTRGADGVVELAAGALRSSDTEAGDIVRFASQEE